MRCGGKRVHLGCFATAEEVALCVARWLEEEQVTAGRTAAEQPLTAEQVVQQVVSERLRLRVAKRRRATMVCTASPVSPSPTICG